MGAAAVERAGPLLDPLLVALTASLEATDAMVRDTGGGWPAAFDVDATPDPRWLASITGTQVPYGVSDATIRDAIRDRAAWRRGTPRAMLSAARTVFPVGLITLVERDGSPWRVTIRLYGAEATPADEARVLAAVATEKPVGIVLAVEVVSGASYDHLEAEATTYPALAAMFPTYSQMRAHVPEEGTDP